MVSFYRFVRISQFFCSSFGIGEFRQVGPDWSDFLQARHDWSVSTGWSGLVSFVKVGPDLSFFYRFAGMDEFLQVGPDWSVSQFLQVRKNWLITAIWTSVSSQDIPQIIEISQRGFLPFLIFEHLLKL